MSEDKILQKLEQHDKQFESIVGKLLEYDDHFDKMGNKIDDLKEEFLQGQDEILTIVKRLDEERVFTFEAVKRLENRVDNHEKELNLQKEDIRKIKFDLKIT